MEVENVYQDDEGKWHIDYSVGHLMGLAIRVCFGEFFLSLIIIIPIAILSALAGFAFGKSFPEKEDAASSVDVQQKSVGNEFDDSQVMAEKNNNPIYDIL